MFNESQSVKLFPPLLLAPDKALGTSKPKGCILPSPFGLSKERAETVFSIPEPTNAEFPPWYNGSSLSETQKLLAQPSKFLLPEKNIFPPKKYNGNRSLFYCDMCDRSFENEPLLLLHNSEHIQCKMDSCKFTAHPKVVALHQRHQHATGFAKKIMALSDPEDIKKWREERKRNFPTAENIRKRQAELEEKSARGELLQTKTFGKMRSNRRGGKFPSDTEHTQSLDNPDDQPEKSYRFQGNQGQKSRFQRGRGQRGRGRGQRGRGRGRQSNRNESLPSELSEPDHHKTHPNRECTTQSFKIEPKIVELEMFRGVLEDYSAVINVAEAPQTVQTKAISVTSVKQPNRLHEDVGLKIMKRDRAACPNIDFPIQKKNKVVSDNSHSKEDVNIPVSSSSQNFDKNKIAVLETIDVATATNSDPIRSSRANQVSDEEGPSCKGEEAKAEPKGALGALMLSYGNSDSDEPPDEVSSKSLVMANKVKEPERKRIVKRPVPDLYPLRNGRVTLLEKLLANEIRHERNVILQCVHYLVSTSKDAGK